ncbi:MAG: DUF2784 domain-containing protein [Bacteroidetes bacterium]|nr:DUF2784 domain-containing protein [Bacteroidota bacterium]
MERYFFHLLTILTVVIHFLFILFVIAGGFLAHKAKWIRIAHLASVLWAVIAELSPGIICPLTSLENYFAFHAGLSTYKEDFITRYLIPVIYQENISTNIQLILVAIVIVINIIAYWIYFKLKALKKKG